MISDYIETNIKIYDAKVGAKKQASNEARKRAKLKNHNNIEQETSSLIEQALEGSSGFEGLETLVRETSFRAGAKILETMVNADRIDYRPTFNHRNGTLMNCSGR